MLNFKCTAIENIFNIVVICRDIALLRLSQCMSATCTVYLKLHYYSLHYLIKTSMKIKKDHWHLSGNCHATWDIIRLLISRGGGGGHSILPRAARSQPTESNVVSMLAHHLRRWPNKNRALVQRIVFDVGSCTRRSQTTLEAGWATLFRYIDSVDDAGPSLRN